MKPLKGNLYAQVCLAVVRGSAKSGRFRSWADLIWLRSVALPIRTQMRKGVVGLGLEPTSIWTSTNLMTGRMLRDRGLSVH
jgi:hypothetical protein